MAGRLLFDGIGQLHSGEREEHPLSMGGRRIAVVVLPYGDRCTGSRRLVAQVEAVTAPVAGQNLIVGLVDGVNIEVLLTGLSLLCGERLLLR